MSEKYSWMNGEIPLIEPHSMVKHEVIKKYINQYIPPSARIHVYNK